LKFAAAAGVDFLNNYVNYFCSDALGGLDIPNW